MLSKLDVIFRAGYIVEDIEFIDNKDVEDLRKLISLVDSELFKANKVCILNPTFGEGSKLVGGADADLVVDDMLLDIKTVKRLTFSRKYLDQLIGYYTLYKIGGIDGMSNQNEINKLGVYFSSFLATPKSRIEVESLALSLELSSKLILMFLSIGSIPKYLLKSDTKFSKIS